MTTINTDFAPWMLVANHLKGLKEIRTKGLDEPKVLELFKIIRNPGLNNDEYSWCAAFVGACLELSGYKSTRDASARNYSKSQRMIKLDAPVQGCIVVFRRIDKEHPNDTQSYGHIGFYDHGDSETISLLGGNQGSNGMSVDSVCIRTRFILPESQPDGGLIGYFWPVETTTMAKSTLLKNYDELIGAVAATPLPITPPQSTVITRDDVLKFGSQGNAVKDLQNKLKSLGYSVGTVDGDFGIRTKSAVFTFQTVNDLPATGMADSDTLRALIGGKEMPISKARQTTTANELRAVGSQTILLTDKAKLMSKMTAGIGGLGLLNSFMGTTLGNTSPDLVMKVLNSINVLLTGKLGNDAIISGIHSLLSGYGVWGGVLAAAIISWLQANKIIERRVEDHTEGENLRH